MKFRGFWKTLWDLNMESLKWLKEYWLAYTLLVVLVTSICFIPYAVYEYEQYKVQKKFDKDIEDFLN